MRFEFSDGGSNKFWDVERAGATLTIKFGKLGAAGQTQLKTFGSEAEAVAAEAKLIAEKTRKGYVAVGGARKPKPAAATAPAPAATAQLGHVTGSIKPTSLVLKPLHDASIHRIVIRDRVVLATGSGCFASSNGKDFHRRDNPGTSYGLFDLDGKIYSLGGPFAVTTNDGASWKVTNVPFGGYRFTLARSRAGQWWMGCDAGVVLTSDRPDRNWKQASFKTGGKVLCILEVDGKLVFAGAGCGAWDGKTYRPLKGFKKSDIVTRVTEAPSGALIAIGDGGIAYRSVDRGASWKPVKSGVDVDLEDCAWVAGALFVVGGQGTLLRSTDEGKTFKKLPTKTQKLWSIASWGDGAILGGDGGLFALASPDDRYWKGAKDVFVPPPPQLDPMFEPQAENRGRDARFRTLLAAAIAEHDKLSAPLRAKRPADANPKLAHTVDEGTEGAEQVYADWLSDRGDPRGELAQIQLRLARDPKNKTLRKAEKQLLAAHREALLGKLAEAAPMLDLEWHAGFITKARIASTFDDDFDDDDEDGDGERTLPPLEKVLGWLLDSPSGRFLRELTVGIVVRDDENSYDGVAKVLGSRYLPALRSLFLGDFTYEDTELNWSTLGNLEPMWAALPNLETLKLRSGSMKLGSIVLPKLRRFTVITGGMDAKAARAIAAARWPSLEVMSLQIGPEPEGGEVKVKDLQPILDGDSLPRLTHLGITNFNHTGALLEPLASSRILPQLSELDLQMGTLGDEHAARMFALQRAFTHLAKLDVHDNYLSAQGKATLKRAGLAFHFGEQRDDEGPEERYASAYE